MSVPSVMMGGVFLMRVTLPDRPGALGAVASAVGTVGGDIHAVEVVGRDAGHAVDDFMLALPPGVMPDELVSACTTIEGVRVLWFSRYPEGQGLEADIEVLERMTAEPAQAAETLAAAAPVVFHCQWALLLDRDARKVTLATEMAPDLSPEHLAAVGPLDRLRTAELPEDWLPGWGEIVVAVTPVRAGRAMLIGRQGGPPFLASELARIRHLAAMAG